MNYTEAIEYIHATAAFGSKLGLDNIRSLMSLLGDPQDKLRFIHIAGTNGKGSVAAYILSIMEQAGYRTALYSSPELNRFSERIRINDKEISDDDVAHYATVVREKAEYMISHDLGSPSEFELVLAMAFLYFLDQDVDIVILEVGLGGRLDATNVINRSLLSVITRISFDHMQYLGDSLPQIAYEKASIIKKDGVVIVYPAEKDILDVYKKMCRLKNASLYIAKLPSENNADHNGVSLSPASRRRFVLDNNTYSTRMLASYETENASLAIQAADLLRKDPETYGLSIADEDIYDGIEKASWPGRFEIISHEPLIIVDGAHNEDGAKALAKTLKEYFGQTKLTLCIGILRDKQYDKMLTALLPFADRVIACEIPNPRTLKAEELSEAISRSTKNVEIIISKKTEDAYQEIKELQYDTAAVIICGSLYLVGPMRELILSGEQSC